MTNDTAYFVLWDDGSWSGNFPDKIDAERCAARPANKQFSSQIVEGEWFPLHQDKDVNK